MQHRLRLLKRHLAIWSQWTQRPSTMKDVTRVLLIKLALLFSISARLRTRTAPTAQSCLTTSLPASVRLQLLPNRSFKAFGTAPPLAPLMRLSLATRKYNAETPYTHSDA